MIRAAVFSRKKTNLCFLEALGSLRFLLVRGCPRLGQPIEKPISPRPSGTGIFPYSRMPALKRRHIFKAPLGGASTDGAIETGFPEGDLSFSVRSTRFNIDHYFSKVFTKRPSRTNGGRPSLKRKITYSLPGEPESGNAAGSV